MLTAGVEVQLTPVDVGRTGELDVALMDDEELMDGKRASEFIEDRGCMHTTTLMHHKFGHFNTKLQCRTQ